MRAAEGLAETADIANGPYPNRGRSPRARAQPQEYVPAPLASRPGPDTQAPAACQCGAARVTPLPDESGAAPARLAHLYLCEGLSTYGIAQLTGLDRQRVTRLLHRAGVPLRPRGAGGDPPRPRRPDQPYLGLDPG